MVLKRIYKDAYTVYYVWKKLRNERTPSSRKSSQMCKGLHRRGLMENISSSLSQKYLSGKVTYIN